MRSILNSSVLVAAERKKLTSPEVIRNVREAAGGVTIVLSSLSVAELAHAPHLADLIIGARQQAAEERNLDSFSPR